MTERRYLRGAKVAHLVEPVSSMAPLGQTWWKALCGLADSEHWWRGTGSQEEYDKAEELPTCKNCLKEQTRAAENLAKAQYAIESWKIEHGIPLTPPARSSSASSGTATGR